MNMPSRLPLACAALALSLPCRADEGAMTRAYQDARAGVSGEARFIPAGYNSQGGQKPLFAGAYSSIKWIDIAGTASKPRSEWVACGKDAALAPFCMGTDDGLPFAAPAHAVSVRNFEMMEAMVTLTQYRECENTFDPNTGRPYCSPVNARYCSNDWPSNGNYPVICMTYEHMHEYARFLATKPGYEGARAPTEAEWEYAATSGGLNVAYPWWREDPATHTPPTCDKAMIQGDITLGCSSQRFQPVCNKRKGNTKQGLCDMAGSVWQLVEDEFTQSYADTPRDGTAFRDPDWGTDYVFWPAHVIRGGLLSKEFTRYWRAWDMRVESRLLTPKGYYTNISFRLARDKK